MRYSTFKAGPWSKRGFVARLLSCLLPRANPDFDAEYQRVVNWWLEIDDNNSVRREIGFDVSGRAVVVAPFGRNCGIFTDLDSAPEQTNNDIASNAFEQQWSKFVLEWRVARGSQIDANVAFPITITWENGEVETYSSFEDLECNLEDFDSEADTGCKVVDAQGCPVRLTLEILELKELRFAHP